MRLPIIIVFFGTFFMVAVASLSEESESNQQTAETPLQWTESAIARVVQNEISKRTILSEQRLIQKISQIAGEMDDQLAQDTIA